MARAFGICLGCLALVISIVRGILMQESPVNTLIHALWMMLAFTVMGFVLGMVTEFLIRQTVEANFRQALKKSGQKNFR